MYTRYTNMKVNFFLTTRFIKDNQAPNNPKSKNAFPLKRNVLLAAVLTVPFLCVTTLVRAEEPCSAYPTGTAEKIESVDLEKTFGAVPGPKKSLHFAYVTKTLINEFWQDVAAGIKNEAAKYKHPGRCAGPQRRVFARSSN